MIEIETLKEFVAYDPISGKFYWKHRDARWFKGKGNADYWNRTYAFQECMKTKDAQGYNIGCLQGKNVYAHRIAWAITHGDWPEDYIDHINGIRNDNRLENLRQVTHKENGRNQGTTARNTSGKTGVYWDKRGKRWGARIRFDGKHIHLGQYDVFAEAVAARKAAEVVLDFHPNHGDRDAHPILPYQRGRRHD